MPDFSKKYWVLSKIKSARLFTSCFDKNWDILDSNKCDNSNKFLSFTEVDVVVSEDFNHILSIFSLISTKVNNFNIPRLRFPFVLFQDFFYVYQRMVKELTTSKKVVSSGTETAEVTTLDDIKDMINGTFDILDEEISNIYFAYNN